MVRSFGSRGWGCVLSLVGALWVLLPLAAKADPKVVGEWSPPFSFAVSATHAHLLPTGKVMIFGEFDEGLQPPQLWDPVTGQISNLPLADYNIFCAGHSYLADGRLLVTGGHEESHVGYPYVSIFNPFTNTWSRTQSMNDNRWYPTNTTLWNGDVVVLSGETYSAGSSNSLPQVWQSNTGTWRDLTTAVRELPYYPRMFTAPNGKLFYAGPGRVSRWLDPEGTGTWYEGPRSAYGGRSYGPAVMYDSKVLIIGGGRPPTATVEEIDLTKPSPTWRARAPMAWPRRQHNATLLPDGKVLVTGGSSGSDFDDDSLAVKVPELFDPETNTWTKLAPAVHYRGYHSTALLLPDGRVLTGGGRKTTTAEVFSPPYLEQDGPRPTIQSVPAAITPRRSFTVQTPDAARISKVTLLGLGSVTHAFDQHQRFLKLPFVARSGALDVDAPSNLDAPPGYYMLFILDERGVPSVARMVQLGTEVPRGHKKILFSDTWKYDDRGIDQGTAWLARDFDDSAWKSGPGQFGYGDGDEGTLVNQGLPTVYFRKKITLENLVTAATLEVLYDDGLAVWINGVPILSRNMGNGTDHGAWASDSTSNAYERLSMPLESDNPFRVGENVVTVMVKQVGVTSNDLTFALALEVEQLSGPVPDTLVLTAPNGGEVFQPGASTTITWSSSGSVSSVDLALSTDGGASWSPIAFGVANTGLYSWTVPDVNTRQALVRVSRVGTPELSDVSNAPFTISRQVNVVAVPFHSEWKYHDDGTDPGMHWMMPHHDDSPWRSGPGQLGYGDRDEATLLTRTSPSQTSVYFRRKLTVDGTITEAQLSVLFDDGIAVWVNGTLVFQRNMDSGLAHDRYASSGTENELASATIPAGLFVQGENTLAVMVKQTGPTSPDLTFDLELRLGLILSE